MPSFSMLHAANFHARLELYSLLWKDPIIADCSMHLHLFLRQEKVQFAFLAFPVA